MDSMLVERFDRVSDERTVSMYRCGIYRHVGFDPLLFEDAKNLKLRFQKLEPLLGQLGDLKERSLWTVLESQKSRFRIQGRQVFISDDLLYQTDVVEKAIFKIWYKERIHRDQLDFTLLEESLTDFLVALTKRSSSNYDGRWPRALMTFKDYCYSSYRYLEHTQMCEKLIQEDSETRIGQLAVPSLRPLLSQVLLETFYALPMERQLQFLSQLGRAIASLSENGNIQNVSSDSEKIDSKRDMVYAAESIKRWAKQIGRLAPIDWGEDFFYSQVLLSLEKRGFTDSYQVSSFDWLFDIEEFNNEKLDSFNELAMKKRELNLALRDNEQIWFLPNKNPISAELLGKIKIFRLVKVSCNWPEEKDFTDESHIVEHVLWIKSCDEEKEISFSELLNSGVKAFSTRNSKIQFMSLHLPSLQAAIERGLKPIEYVLSAEGQATSRYQQDFLSYQPGLALTGIEYYRP